MQNEHALAVWRKTQNLSQDEFAAKVGISRWMVNRIETGNRRPSLDLALKIQTVTENVVSPAELVTSDAPVTPQKRRSTEREGV